MAEIEPLKGKHYSTKVSIQLPNGEYIGVEVYGCNKNPSQREIDNGWEPDYGMDHVEGDKVYEVAIKIKALLEELYNV